MVIKPFTDECIQCRCNYTKKDRRQKFCSTHCAGTYNGLRRVCSEETKKKIALSVKNRYSTAESRASHSKVVGKSTKGKYKTPTSILELSSRTVGKIFKRMGVGCCLCGWNKGACDIHHINGRKITDANSHWNLTYICPNCHREFHSGNIQLKELFIPLTAYIGEKWRDFYYG